MEQILQSYYRGIKENMTSAELRWKEELDSLVEQEQMDCLTLNKLFNQAINQKFKLPFELKRLKELGAKLYEEINTLLLVGKSFDEFTRLRDKILENKVIPLNFRQLEEKIGQYEGLKDFISKKYASEQIQFSDLVDIYTRIQSFNNDKDFKHISSRYLKAKSINDKFESFLRNIQMSTRGQSVNQLNYEEALAVLEKADALGVQFANLEAFRNEVDKAKGLISACEEYLQGSDIQLEKVNEFLEKFELINFKSSYPEKLGQILENLRKVQAIKKKRFELEKLDKNLEQV